MEDNKCGILWGLTAELREGVSQQIALHNPGPVCGGNPVCMQRRSAP
jgi:hypothetical protein